MDQLRSGAYSVGDPVQFNFSYDTSTAGVNGLNFMQYENSLQSLVAQVGSHAIILHSKEFHQ